MSEHTPGPWTASIGTRGAQIHIANDANHPLSFGFSWSELDHDLVREAQANARLIAAAPDQYRALEKVDRQLENAERRLVGLCPHPKDIEWAKTLINAARQTAQAAIAEAEGAAVHD